MKRIEVEQRTILLGITGSQAYKTNTPASDMDARGIFIASDSYYLGLLNIEQKDKGWKGEEGGTSLSSFIDSCDDICLYELRKFLKLALDNNPNILELLYLDEYVTLDLPGEALLEYRQKLLSKRVKYTWSGYANAQLKKIKSHRKWLLEPPKAPPHLADFGLTEETLISKDRLHAFYEFLYVIVRDAIEYSEPAEDLYNILISRIDYKGVFKQHPFPKEALPYIQNLTNSSDDYISKLQKTQEYRSALSHWKNYLSWKENRNPKRAAMEAKVGYDVKHAMF